MDTAIKVEITTPLHASLMVGIVVPLLAKMPSIPVDTMAGIANQLLPMQAK